MAATTDHTLRVTRTAFFDYLLNHVDRVHVINLCDDFAAFSAELSAYIEHRAPWMFNPSMRTRKTLHREFEQHLAAACLAA